YRWSSVFSVTVTLLAILQLPNTAGTPTVEPKPKFDPLHRVEPQGKPRDVKLKVSFPAAWVAKYQVGPSGIRKLMWRKQMNTLSYAGSYGVATDSSGNVFITGETFGSIGGTNQGELDVWVAKYNPDGILIWIKQLGSSAVEKSYGVATDRSGNVFITGSTVGSLGGNYKGQLDAWVAKFSPDGTLLWTKHLGTSTWDQSYGVATDSKGNVFITGITDGALGGKHRGSYDAWVAKYSPDGTLVWIRQLGTSTWDESYAVATDNSGNIFITGETLGSLGSPSKGTYDAWVAKFNSAGTLKWKRQLGDVDHDFSLGVATDGSGNVLITGSTRGSLGSNNQGVEDAWVAKFTPDGTLRWLKQLGTSSADISNSVATDSSGNVFIIGWTEGVLEGGISNRFTDTWVAKFSPDGKQLWLRQDGARSYDEGKGIAVDVNGYVLTTGETEGNFVRN
ncbi:MAG TPA: SBBP repeat-containing protein, partial [Stenomitos sp.]